MAGRTLVTARAYSGSVRGNAVFAAVLAGFFLAGHAGLSSADAEPEVKKSRAGICHDQDSVHYERTKNFVPYDSMEACIESGGTESRATPRRSVWRMLWAGVAIGLMVLIGWLWLKKPPPGPGARLDEFERRRWEGHRRE